MADLELMPGTLDLLILKTISLEPMHGWGIQHRIQQLSRDVFRVNQGSLYPSLQRLMRRGLIKSEWRVTENNRRARYYELTGLGRSELEAERRQWELSSVAMGWVLNASLKEAQS